MLLEVFGLNVVSDRKARIPFTWLVTNAGQRDISSLDLQLDYFRQFDPDYLEQITEGSLLGVLCENEWSRSSAVEERFDGAVYMHGEYIGYISLHQYREFDKINIASRDTLKEELIPVFRNRFGISLRQSKNGLSAVVRK